MTTQNQQTDTDTGDQGGVSGLGFLTDLFRGVPSAYYITLCAIDKSTEAEKAAKVKKPVTTYAYSVTAEGIQQVVAQAALLRARQKHVYIRTSVLTVPPKQGTRGNVEEAAGAATLWAECDSRKL